MFLVSLKVFCPQFLCEKPTHILGCSEASLNVSSLKSRRGKKKKCRYFSPVLLEDNIWSVVAQNITKTSVESWARHYMESN